MVQLKLAKLDPDWEKRWDQAQKRAEQIQPIKRLKTLPNMPGVTPETAKGLKWKALKYMVTRDKGSKILRHFFKHPFRYGFRYLCSLLKKQSYLQEKDFFLYGFSSIEAFKKKVQEKNTLLVVGFSYCQKPFECPSGRFTDQCMCDPDHLVCRQCDIGKALGLLPQNKVKALMIPTIHYIGDQIFQLVHRYPNKQILFLITACELTLKMFGDWGHMAAIKGIGVRLDGRICNTMRAFELSEEGIKPGLTVLTSKTQARLIALLQDVFA